MCWAAAEALGEIGDAGAVPALIKALSDSDFFVRMVAAEALGEIGDAGTVPVLTKALADSNDGVRRAAAEALGRIVTNNNELDIAIVREAAKKLAIHAYDWSESVRTAAAEALERAVALLTLRKVTEDQAPHHLFHR